MITSELLEAYLVCPLKCYLWSRGEECAENSFAGARHHRITVTVQSSARNIAFPSQSKAMGSSLVQCHCNGAAARRRTGEFARVRLAKLVLNSGFVI